MQQSNVYKEIRGLESPEWERLKAVLQKIGYGEIRIILQAGKPIRIETGIKQIKLDGSQGDFNSGLDTIPI